MTMRHVKRIQFKMPGNPPTIEFDPAVMAWYVRFRNAKVAKTISEESSGYIYAVDLDTNNQVIGVELLGALEFTIGGFKAIPGIDATGVDFEQARFVPAASCDPVLA